MCLGPSTNLLIDFVSFLQVNEVTTSGQVEEATSFVLDFDEETTT